MPCWATEPTSKESLREIAGEAYAYFWPLVVMEVTRQEMMSAPTPPASPTRMNSLNHRRAFPDDRFRSVVRPNVDTLYSMAWIDLRRGHVIIEVPDVGDRYYLLQFLDMWTDTVGSLGTRTTGNKAGRYAVVGPDGKEKVDGVASTITSPTPFVWMIGRFQTNGKSDYENVHRLQDGLKLIAQQDGEPLNLPIPGAEKKLPPMLRVSQLTPGEFFALASRLFQIHPPHVTDQPIVERLKRIHLTTTSHFVWDDLEEDVRQAMEDGVTDAKRRIAERIEISGHMINGWRVMNESMGVYGNDYWRRAGVAMYGLGANSPEDAIYPRLMRDGQGQPLSGTHRYRFRIPADDMPPANAFWSLTIYDQNGYLAKNPIDRFALGDRDALRREPDGSIVLYIQETSPGPELESNWLPVPNGPISPTFRMYLPRAEALDGKWAPPPFERLPD
jgi:hypothetical protein